MAVDAVGVGELLQTIGLGVGLVGGAWLGMQAMLYTYRVVMREVLGVNELQHATSTLTPSQVAAIKAKEAAGGGAAGGGDYSGLGVDYSSYSKDELFALNDRLYAEIGYGPDGEIPADKMDKHYQLFEVQDEIERRMR